MTFEVDEFYQANKKWITQYYDETTHTIRYSLNENAPESIKPEFEKWCKKKYEIKKPTYIITR